MKFSKAYNEFIQFHIQNSGGDRRKRLEEHGFAEKLFLEQVWWPLFGNFKYLHPEYEYRDFEDKTRFIDFAYLRPPFRVGHEVLGYGPHWRDVSRWKFGDDQTRHSYLTCDGWVVMFYAFDDVNDKYRRCQRMVLDLISVLWGTDKHQFALSLGEKEVVKLASRRDQITITDVKKHLRIGKAAATTLLRSLVEKNWLLPCKGGNSRVLAYKLNPEWKPFYYMI